MMQKKIYKITIGNPEQDVILTVKRELSETEYNLVQGIISEFQNQIAKIEEESESFVDLVVDVDESTKDGSEDYTHVISDEDVVHYRREYEEAMMKIKQKTERFFDSLIDEYVIDSEEKKNEIRADVSSLTFSDDLNYDEVINHIKQ